MAALRYVRYSTAVRALIIRAGVVMFFASALLALLPTVAHNVSGSPIAFGLLLGCFGAGAVLGAFVLQPARVRWSTETVDRWQDYQAWMHVEAPDKSAEIARIFSYQDAILVNTSRENGMIWRAAASHVQRGWNASIPKR
jgi:hypothetical protein